MIAEMTKMRFWKQVKGGEKTSGWMYGQNHESKKDELNFIDKRMGRQQSILKGSFSAQNYLVQFKVQSVVTLKCNSARLQVELSHKMCIMYQSIPSITILPRGQFSKFVTILVYF